MKELLLLLLFSLVCPYSSGLVLKVISMNMWGIHSPFSTPVPEREDRMIGAAKIIKKGQYDFVMFQEVWDDEDVDRIKEVLGDEFYLTRHDELSPKCLDKRKSRKMGDIGDHIKSWGMNKRHPGQSGRNGVIPQFLCSGLLIASKYKTFVSSEFVEFEEHGTWPTDCINYECYTRKGVGRVRFSIPLNVEPGIFEPEPQRSISVDIYTTHTHSDETYTGQASDKRVKQMNQIMPAIENSDAEVVILGGDFNDHPLSETYQILTRKMTDAATEVYNFNHYANNSDFYTYGNIYNTYSSDTEQDFKRTLDYIVFRKPRMQDKLDIKVLDYRLPHHVTSVSYYPLPISLSDHEQVEVTLEIKGIRN